MTSSFERSAPKKRVLIVNAYLDDSRQRVRRTNKLPCPMGPVYLAGAFCRERCEVRVHEEMYSGQLEDPALLGWPDMLVLTGLTMALDRMLHLAAYARTLRPDVIVVAGGPAIRTFPRFAAQFFDYCSAAMLWPYEQVTAPRQLLGSFRRTAGRTFVGPTERLDPAYRPAFPVAAHYAHYLRPTAISFQESRRSWGRASALLLIGGVSLLPLAQSPCQLEVAWSYPRSSQRTTALLARGRAGRRLTASGSRASCRLLEAPRKALHGSSGGCLLSSPRCAPR